MSSQLTIKFSTLNGSLCPCSKYLLCFRESSILSLFISKRMCTADTVKSHETGIACGFTNNVGLFSFFPLIMSISMYTSRLRVEILFIYTYSNIKLHKWSN